MTRIDRGGRATRVRATNVAGLRSGPRDSGAAVPAAPAERVVSRRVRVAAAKAQVAVDRRRGVETEDWILELADSAP